MRVHARQQRLRFEAEAAGRQGTLAFGRFMALYERRYSDDQPRVPAGQPGAGQWTFGDGEDGSDRGPSSPASDASILLAGGIAKEDEARIVQEFMSANCKGSIRAEMPGQFLDMTIGEVQALAKSGVADARTCLKLLGRDKYRK